MTVRLAMSALISRVRLLINDPSGSSQLFLDQDIQDVMDSTRLNVTNGETTPQPTYSGSSISYLDYYTNQGDWEDDLVLKQYLTVVVSPATSENIVGHWTFAANTFPPVYITGKTYDVYRSAADLLERMAAKWVLKYDFSSDSQSFRASQVVAELQKLADTYRMKQRIGTIGFLQSHIAEGVTPNNLSLAPTPLDYMASGQ